MINPNEIQLILSLIKALPEEDQAEFFAELREHGMNVAAKLILVRAFKKQREALIAERESIAQESKHLKDNWEKKKKELREKTKDVVRDSNKQFAKAFEDFKHELSTLEREMTVLAEKNQKAELEKEISDIEDLMSKM